MEQFTKDGLDRAIEHLQHGLTIIGENALLCAGIGYAYYNYANLGIGPDENADRAEEYARKALVLDPNSAQAHFVLGAVYQAFRGDQRQAFHHLNRSLAINPDDPHTLFWLVVAHWAVGNLDASRPLVARAQRLDPLNPMARYLTPWVDLGTGQYDRAADFAWHQLPKQPYIDMIHAIALAYAQRFDDARAFILERAQAQGDDSAELLIRLLALALDRQGKRIDELLRGEIATTFRRDPVWCYFVASFCALAGSEATALEWLAVGIDRGLVNYPLLAKRDPFLATLRGGAQFDALIERVKDEWERFEV